MNNSMITSMVTLHSLQQRIDTMAHNIANVNTVGYKKLDASFQDILTATQQQHQDFELKGRYTPLGITEGFGAKLSALQVNLSQGSLVSTDNPMNLALEGNALLEVAKPTVDANGNQGFERLFTRTGTLQMVNINNTFYLATDQGMLLTDQATGQAIAVPEGRRIVIDDRGNITAYQDGVANAQPEQLGQLSLVHVERPNALMNVGENLFGVASDADPNQVLRRINLNDPAQLEQYVTNPMGGRAIAVRQGYLEQSNVNLADEMTELMTVQRAYQLNTRAISISDTMMNLANSLRG